MSSTTSNTKIAIIGAGPAGCTLARLLLLANIPCTIFEGELAPDLRSQGGTLDLHDSTGLLAIRKAGLYDEFIKLARFDGDALAVCDKKMLRYLNLKSSKEGSWFSQGKPEIDRADLRRLLLDVLPRNLIRWGYKLKTVDPVDLALEFENGVVEKGFDLVVGADGAWSRVRSLLTDQVPFYSGVGGHNLIISDAKAKFPELEKLVNRGSLFSFGDGRVVMGQQMGDGSIYVSIWGVRSENWMKETAYNIRSGTETKRALLAEYKDWSDEIRSLIDAADEDKITPRSLFMFPVNMTWNHRAGVTLIGDSAHLMTPFVGEGVNAAMKDAVELAEAIVVAAKQGGGKKVLSDHVQSYEKQMWTRVHKVMVMTEDMMKLMLFTEGAPRSVIDKWIVRSMSDDMNMVLALFLRA